MNVCTLRGSDEYIPKYSGTAANLQPRDHRSYTQGNTEFIMPPSYTTGCTKGLRGAGVVFSSC